MVNKIEEFLKVKKAVLNTAWFWGKKVKS
jgi:hypothetical protein